MSEKGDVEMLWVFLSFLFVVAGLIILWYFAVDRGQGSIQATLEITDETATGAPLPITEDSHIKVNRLMADGDSVGSVNLYT